MLSRSSDQRHRALCEGWGRRGGEGCDSIPMHVLPHVPPSGARPSHRHLGVHAVSKPCLHDLEVPTGRGARFIPMGSGESPANPPASPATSSSVSSSAPRQHSRSRCPILAGAASLLLSPARCTSNPLVDSQRSPGGDLNVSWGILQILSHYTRKYCFSLAALVRSSS